MTSAASTEWVIPDVWETVARTRPAAACITQGPRNLTWCDFDRQADGFGACLLAAGLGHQAKVALALHNCPEFLVGVFGSLKAGLVPLNTNVRYTAREAAQIWIGADAEVVVFSDSIVEVVAAARRSCPLVRRWYWVDDTGRECPVWATPFPGPADESVTPAWGRSPDDLILLYTGGTTGLPKGVMWRQDDVFAILNATAAIRYPASEGLTGVARLQADEERFRPRFLPCGPLVHGTAAFSTYGVLGAGGSVVLLTSSRFDAVEVLDTIDAERVTHLSMIGDAHVRPLVGCLTAEPARWSLASLRLVTSAGMALSPESRAALLQFCPDALCVDVLGSSEAPLLGRSRSTRAAAAAQGVFEPGPDVRVVDDQGRSVTPGSGQVGTIVVRGRGPLGYYKDDDAGTKLFRIVDGQPWVAPGDLASVAVDGTIQLRGRASSVINTGGEKVYAREVEDALVTHPAVTDAVVLGLPHHTLGQMVVAAVQLATGTVLDVDDLAVHLRQTLAGYKIPKEFHVLGSVERGDNGKVDLRALTRRLAELSAASSTATPASERPR